MKYFVIFAACLIALVNAGDEFSAEFKEKLINKVQEVGAKCVATEKATGDDITELMQQKSPSTKEGKCLLSCFYQAFGSQDASGKFTKASAEKALEPFKKANEGVYNKMLELVEKCLPEVKSTERCEAANEMLTCGNAHAKEFGLTPDLIL